MKKILLSAVLLLSAASFVAFTNAESKEKPKKVETVECCCKDCQCKDCQCESDCSKCEGCRVCDECKACDEECAVCENCQYQENCCNYKQQQRKYHHKHRGCCRWGR